MAGDEQETNGSSAPSLRSLLAGIALIPLSVYEFVEGRWPFGRWVLAEGLLARILSVLFLLMGVALIVSEVYKRVKRG